MNPFDCYAKAWTGWDDKDQQKQNDSNPFLDQFSEAIRSTIHDMGHDAVKDYMCQGVLGEAVNRGMISSDTAQKLLPVLEFVYDKVDPCHV